MSIIHYSLFTIHYSLKRWWQSMGFGIQSRTDYEYLHEVLKEDLPYYAYSELPDKQSQLIYRICNHAHRGKVALAGDFNATERKAASMATHDRAEMLDELTSIHLYDTILVKDIAGAQSQLWQLALEGNCITWDIKGILGIIQRIKERYPEHYRI